MADLRGRSGAAMAMLPPPWPVPILCRLNGLGWAPRYDFDVNPLWTSSFRRIQIVQLARALGVAATCMALHLSQAPPPNGDFRWDWMEAGVR